MKKSSNRRSWQSIKSKMISNVVLGVLVLSVGALCLSPVEDGVVTSGEEERLYRHAGADGKGISLTFNVYSGTEEVYQILDILNERRVKASFFIGGCWADDNVQCLRDIYAAGHEIGNHGYFHKSHDTLSLSDNLKEISDCNQFIKLAVGNAPTLFAPPSGAYGKNSLEACKRLEMKTILWSKDTIDWRDQDVGLIYSRATKNAQTGDFILMHPTKATVAALEDILIYYERNSLSVVTVSENLQGENTL